MQTFTEWIKINQVRNALEYLEAFPELKTVPDKAAYLRQLGHTDSEASILAAQLSAILSKSVRSQDFLAKTPDDWATINKLP